MDVALGVVVVVAALAFAWTNGVHDAANAVATSLVTGSLTPRVALAMAAVLNVIGGLVGVAVAGTLRRGLFDVPVLRPGNGILLAGLVAAIAWNLLTWWAGLPSSSSHALVGGLAGAGLAAGAGVDRDVLVGLVLVPTLLSPVVGFVGALVLVRVLLHVTRDAAHAPTLRRFRVAQTVSAAAMALGHGLQDARKTAAVMVAALSASGWAAPGEAVPGWVGGSAAVALGVGTAFGGRRIIRTLGRRLVPVDPVSGFAAESVAAASLYAASGLLAAPVSSTQVVVAAVLGSGTGVRGLRAVRWLVVRRVVAVFVLTPLVTGLLAAALFRAAA